MTISAKLPDGTTLEFPDETPDEVVDATVKKHVSGAAAGVASPQPVPADYVGIPEPVDPTQGAEVPEGLSRDAAGQTHFRLPQIKDGGWSIQGVGLKALRDTAAGVGSLPFDLVGANDAAESVRQNLPQIELNSTPGDVLSAVAQYGIPGMAGYKAGRAAAGAAEAIPAMANSPIAMRILQWLGGLTGAGVTDAAVTDPDKAATIGNLIGGPTAINQDDSAIEKRAKVGAEGVAVGAVTDRAVTAAKAVGRGVKTFAKGVFNPVTMSTGKPVPPDALAAHGIPENQSYEAAAASDILKKSTDDIPAAVKAIDDTKARFAHDPSFQPMTGETTNDPGLLGMQRGYSSDRELLAHDRQNIASTDRLRQEVTKPGPNAVLGDKARAEFETQIGTQRAAAEAGAATAEKNLADAKAARRAVEGEIENRIPQREDAAAAVDAKVNSKLDTLTAEKNRRFDTIDPSGSVEVDIKPLYRAAKEATRSNGILDSGVKSRVRQYAGPTLDRIKRAYRYQKEELEAAKTRLGGDTIPFPNKFRDLQQIRSELSGAIKKAKEDGAGDVVERLTTLKRAFDEYPEQLAQMPHAAGERAQDAVNYFKDEFAPAARQGKGGEYVNKKRASSTGLPPTETPKHFVRTDENAGREGADALNRLVGANDVDVRKYAVADMAKHSTRMNGEVDVGKLDSWIRNRREFLDANKEIRREINQMRNRLTGSSEKVGALEEELKAAVAGQKRTEAEISKSAANLFVGRDPVEAIGEVMKRSNKHGAIRELVSRAQKDASGDAVKGLRTAFGEWLEKSVTNTGRNVDEELLTSAAKLENMFKDRDTANALHVLYDGTDNIKILNEVRERLSIMARRNQKVTRGSDTQINKKSAGDTNASVLTTIYHLSSGKGIISSQMLVARGVRLTRWLSGKFLNLGPDQSKEIVDSILKKSMTDPDLAKTLLMHDSQANEKIIHRRLGTYVTNNLLSKKEDKKDR